jgi:Fe-S oxidoreductase
VRLTLVHPCIGRRVGQPYIRTWQMEPLAPATLAGLTPKGSGIDVRFYDDRTETIPYDEPTDLVAMSVETYTARRSYQIASEFRRRGVPVVMGGFHPTLVPDEASEYAEAIVIGEAEGVWPRVLNDFAAGRCSASTSRHSVRRFRVCGRTARSLPASVTFRWASWKREGAAISAASSAPSSRTSETPRPRPTEEILEEVGV